MLVVIDCYFKALTETMRRIPSQDIEAVVQVLFAAWKNDARVFIMGNGGSASTAAHFACDLAKATITKGKKRFRVQSLVDNVPLVSAWTNDHGFGSIFAEQLEPWLETGDVLIGISVHGGSGSGEAGPWSQNLVRAVRLARRRGAKVVGLSGFDGGLLKEEADACVVVPVSAEPFGTPLVESLHVAVHHLICLALRQKIAGGALKV
ncbi:MAG: SIS domain-containing protein [Peptococcaceae bacterium]|nr:MAG: SIS domain-containing protein [Peptococcaceae bacterium]